MAETTEDMYRATHPGCLRIYDAGIDNYRNVTQEDVDLLIKASGNGYKVRELANKLHQEYVNTARDYTVIRELP